MKKQSDNPTPSFKCQIRLTIAKRGIRVTLTVDPDCPGAAGMKIWPDIKNGKDRLVEMPAGRSRSTEFDVKPDEAFWVEVIYGTAREATGTLKMKYEPKRPFGFRITRLTNPDKVDLTGSVPRIKVVRR